MTLNERTTPASSISGRRAARALAAFAFLAAGLAATLPAAAQIALGDGSLKIAKVDKQRPKVSIVAPANHATVSGNVAITAAARDQFGVVGVQFFADGQPVGAEAVAAPFSVAWNTQGVANGTHTLTATARDAAGHRSSAAPVTVVVQNAAPVAARIEDSNPAVTFTAGWQQDTSRSWSGGSARATRMVGTQATLAFTGTSANWIGGRGPQFGIARVYIDGTLKALVDGYQPTEEIRVPMFTVNDLPAGAHTLTIETTGTKNADAADILVAVDAFDTPAVSVSRQQEVDSAVAYSGTWTQGDTSRAWSEGAAAQSAQATATATFAFTGTGIAWVGKRAPDTGIAGVYVDGVFQAYVDTWAANEQVQAELFALKGLAPGPHTLAVQVTGQKNASSSGQAVFVDAFEVTVPGRRYQDTDPAITWFPRDNWYLATRDHAYSEGSQGEAVFGGSTATFPFTGTGISLVGATCIRCGIIRVSIDGGVATTVDLYATTDSPQQTVYRIAGLAPGAHTIVVEVTGDKNPLSTYYWVVVDAFDVIP